MRRPGHGGRQRPLRAGGGLRLLWLTASGRCGRAAVFRHVGWAPRRLARWCSTQHAAHLATLEHTQPGRRSGARGRRHMREGQPGAHAAHAAACFPRWLFQRLARSVFHTARHTKRHRSWCREWSTAERGSGGSGGGAVAGRWRCGGGQRRCDSAWLELWQASQEKLVRNICRRTVWNKLEMLGLMALAAEAIRERDCERLGRPDSGASGR